MRSTNDKALNFSFSSIKTTHISTKLSNLIFTYQNILMSYIYTYFIFNNIINNNGNKTLNNDNRTSSKKTAFENLLTLSYNVYLRKK